MTKQSMLLKKIWDENSEVASLFFDYDCETPYCYLKEREIHLPLQMLMNPSYILLFDFLHEIGHLRTNKNKMKRCLQECLATKWAIKESVKYGIVIPRWRQRQFDEDIKKWFNVALKHNAKCMPDKRELALDWSVMK